MDDTDFEALVPEVIVLTEREWEDLHAVLEAPPMVLAPLLDALLAMPDIFDRPFTPREK